MSPHYLVARIWAMVLSERDSLIAIKKQAHLAMTWVVLNIRVPFWYPLQKAAQGGTRVQEGAILFDNSPILFAHQRNFNQITNMRQADSQTPPCKGGGCQDQSDALNVDSWSRVSSWACMCACVRVCHAQKGPTRGVPTLPPLFASQHVFFAPCSIPLNAPLQPNGKQGPALFNQETRTSESAQLSCAHWSQGNRCVIE